MRKSGKVTVDLMNDKLKNVNFLACSLANYAKGRNGRGIKYIVMHYTAGDGARSKHRRIFHSMPQYDAHNSAPESERHVQSDPA